MSVADLNFGDILDALAPAIAERPAIVCGGLTRSWRELDERSNRLARHLMGLGLEPDSKVAFYLNNGPAYLELMAACFKARLVHANVNYRYVDHELRHVIDNSDAEVVVYDAEFRPHAEALRPGLPGVRAWIEVSETPDAGLPGSFEAACSHGDPSPLGIPRAGTDLYFMYTGGTTGYPKAVMWQHRERIAVIGMAQSADVASHAASVAAAGPGPVALPACPLMHSTGFTTALGTLVGGGTVVLLPSRSFDPAVCLEEIERNRVERLAIVGDAFSVPMLAYLAAHPDAHDLSSVALISSAGAMWSEQSKRGLLEHFREATLSDSLGSSEGSRLAFAVTRRGEGVRTGAFQLGADVKVFTEDFREVVPGSGEAGMIATSGPLPLGYYKDEARTAKTFPVIGGVRYSMAGDWCRVEADGSITLLGRGSNCINTGGEKVYPEEVEEILKTVPGIRDAAVLGVPDERWGQAVAALVATESGRPLDRADIQGHLDPLLARYKHPKRYTFVADDFRHENGKVNYRAVQRLMDEAAGEPGQG